MIEKAIENENMDLELDSEQIKKEKEKLSQ